MQEKKPTIFWSYLPACALLLISFLCCQPSYARDLQTVSKSHSSTSDDIDLTAIRFSYLSNQREYFWPYAELSDSEWDWGIDAHHYHGQTSGTDFNGQHLEGIIGWRYSESSYLNGRFGFHRLDVADQNDTRSRPTYDLNAHFGLADDFDLQINVTDDYVYALGMQPAGAREFLHADQWQMSFDYRVSDTVRMSGTASLWSLSDSNSRRQHSASLLYGISPVQPWIWAGVSYEYLRFFHAKPGYWTPYDYLSVNLVFESSFPIFENLSGALSASLSKIKEDQNPVGDGDSFNAGLDYALTENITLRVGISRITSVQSGSGWYEESYYLSLNGAF